MNNGQSYIVASSVVLCIILTTFLLPWRLERNGELRWGPFYRPPISYNTTWEGPVETTVYQYEEADLAFGVLGLELFGLFILSMGLYHTLDDRTHESEFYPNEFGGL